MAKKKHQKAALLILYATFNPKIYWFKCFRGGGMIFLENKHPSIKLCWQVLHSWFLKTINIEQFLRGIYFQEQFLRGIYFQEITQPPWTSKGKFFPFSIPLKNSCISPIRRLKPLKKHGGGASKKYICLRFFLNQVFKTYHQRYFHPTLIFDKNLLFTRRVLISKLRNL